MENSHILGQLEDLLNFKSVKEGVVFTGVYVFKKKFTNEIEEKENDFFLLFNKENEEPMFCVEIINDMTSFIIRRLYMVGIKMPYYIGIYIENKKLEQSFYYAFSKRNNFYSEMYPIQRNFIMEEFGIEIEFERLKLE